MARIWIILAASLLGFDASQAQITVRGRLAHDVDVIPGQTIIGSVVVDNETEEPQQAKIYLKDYLFYADGTNSYDDPGTGMRSNASWVQFSPEAATVPPGGSVTVSYSISIPDSAHAGSFLEHAHGRGRGRTLSRIDVWRLSGSRDGFSPGYQIRCPVGRSSSR